MDVPTEEMLAFERKHGAAPWLRDLDAGDGSEQCARMAKDLEIQEEMRDAIDDENEKSSWDKMVKLREKMGKGPPCVLPYESEERTNKIISQFSGSDHGGRIRETPPEWKDTGTGPKFPFGQEPAVDDGWPEMVRGGL